MSWCSLLYRIFTKKKCMDIHEMPNHTTRFIFQISVKHICCAEFNSFSLALHLNKNLTQLCCVLLLANGPGSLCRRQPMRDGYFVITEAPESNLFHNFAKKRLRCLKSYERLLHIISYATKLSKTAKRFVKKDYRG
jgi:hypothetical protein